jgi:hypothetical protein
MHTTLRFSVLILALALIGCRQAPPSSSAAEDGAAPPWTLTIEPVQSPAPPGSLAPRLSTSPAGTLVSWIERKGSTTTLRYAERTAGGWAPPVTVASGDNWFVSYADVPSVVRKTDGTLVANWLVTTDAFIEAYDLVLSYSRDNGRTWARPFSPHHDGTMTQHGFASFYELPGNVLGLLWLDGRQQELDTTSPEGGAMSLRSATFDGNWKETSEKGVDLRVCECCATTVAVTADGVLTAYRDRSDSEVRDIRVSWLAEGEWTPGPLVHADNWTIPACPVNGPMLAASGKSVAVAWFTTVNDTGHAFAAFSSDSGRSWGQPIPLDDAGSLGQVGVVMLDDGSAAATWIEFANQQAQLKVRRVEPSGARSEATKVTADGVRPTGVPRVARVGEELLFAWTESSAPEGDATEGVLQMKTAAARVPRATAVR